MESIAEENLHDILLRLSTKDVARCRCVCKPWRRLLATLSFRRLHARAVAGSGGGEALLVSQARPRGKTMETTVLCVSSANPLCCVVDLAEEYCVASVCNGFIVLASGEKEYPSCKVSWDPVFVCNPVTGEKLQIPAPPVFKTVGPHLFAMGFSASNHQHKLFRLPIQESMKDDNYLGVYTIEGGGGWRRHPDLFRRPDVCWVGSAPVLVDGKIYVLTKRNPYLRTTPNNILVIDVLTEAYRTYGLMPDQETYSVAMSVFELGGQPCIAVLDDCSELHIWIMPKPQLVQGGQQQLDEKLPGNWVRRYSFYCDRDLVGYSPDDEPVGTWVEGQGILCCIIGDHMYRYDTTKDKEEVGCRFSAWDHKLRLPSPPDGFYERRGIFGGYRPTLLSPQDLDEQQHDNVDEQFEQSWLSALRSNKPSNQCMDNGSDQHLAKRRIHS